MSILLFNFSWMTFNIFLAVLPIFFGFTALRAKNKFIKYFFALLWLLFLPNTVYLFTDLINMMRQWGMHNFNEKLVLIFQYGVLEVFGLVTFILAVYPFQQFLRNNKFKGNINNKIIIILNFIIAFGITLGRVERINSWDIVSNPAKVIFAGFHILSSIELIAFTILFAVFANITYFLFKEPIIKYFSTYLVRVGA